MIDRFRIATNFERFPRTWEVHGTQGESVYCRDFAGFWRASATADLLIVNCDPGISCRLGLLFRLLPWRRKRVLVVDLVLPAPKRGVAGWLRATLKRFSLGGVWHFIHHFRDLKGYERYFGIGASRSSYLPFKTNLTHQAGVAESAGKEGDYVLCMGYSERDYDTFFAAMEKLPAIPGAIAMPDWQKLAAHGSVFSRSIENLPANVALLDDQGDEASQVRMLRGARVVALPLIPNRIKASGVSIYLNAMLMGKCVMTSEGPGTSDVLDGEAILTPPGDASALAAAIQRIWCDVEERCRIAAAGQRYAQACGTEADSHQRVLQLAVRLVLE
jgi:glycosyltransferase involved in cell wall biosynthesis